MPDTLYYIAIIIKFFSNLLVQSEACIEKDKISVKLGNKNP